MYKILLLTDFSAASQHAMAFTQNLFADTAADFCLLHAFPIQPEVSYGGALLLAEQEETAERALQSIRQELTRQPEPPYHTYRTKVMPGGPLGVVDLMLAHEHFDLVVVGATGNGRSEFFGSVATGIIRMATTNVLIVPATAAIRPVEQMVLATDYRSVNDTGSFALLEDLASRKAAQLTVLTIENPRQPDAQASEPSRRYVLKALETIQTDTYTIHDTNVLQGINTYLDTHTVDLLVLLPHHKGFFDVLRNNSVTRSFAYHPRVPLLALYDPANGLPTAAAIDLADISSGTYL